MFPVSPKHNPSIVESIVFLLVIIGEISYFIIRLEVSPHIPITLGIFILLAYGLFRRISFKDLEEGMIFGAKSGMSAVFLFLLIGVLISTWMISGTIPALIAAGFQIVGGTWFYAIVFAITAITGIALGSSLTTTATIGVAFISMGSALDASLAITAGAIVSGAFFGDKMSPLSDTTNLASTIVQVDLFDHIKHMSLTTIPAFLITFVIFIFLSPGESIPAADIKEYQNALASTGLIHWSSWLPLVVLIICTIFRVPAFMALALSSLMATLLAGIISPFTWTDIWKTWFEGFEINTDSGAVNEWLSGGGITGMLSTVSLVILALGFGGLLFVTGIIPSILHTFKEKLKRVRSIVIATASTAVGVNVFIGEQYLSILLTGETFKGIYQEAKLPNKVLARTLEDAGTVINPLVPWSVCGVFIYNVLGVPVLTYLPFAFFCLLSPLITIIFGGRSFQRK